jgi:hypothetical protein
MADSEGRPQLDAIGFLLDKRPSDWGIFLEVNKELIVELRQELQKGNVPKHLWFCEFSLEYATCVVDHMEKLLNYLSEEGGSFRNSDRASAS